MAGRKSLNRPQVVAGRVASRPGRQRPLVLGRQRCRPSRTRPSRAVAPCRRSAPKLDAAIADVGNLAKSIDAAKVGRTVDNVDRFAQGALYLGRKRPSWSGTLRGNGAQRGPRVGHPCHRRTDRDPEHPLEPPLRSPGCSSEIVRKNMPTAPAVLSVALNCDSKHGCTILPVGRKQTMPESANPRGHIEYFE